VLKGRSATKVAVRQGDLLLVNGCNVHLHAAGSFEGFKMDVCIHRASTIREKNDFPDRGTVAFAKVLIETIASIPTRPYS